MFFLSSPIFEANKSTERIFLKLHGFRDSPVALHNLTSSANLTKIRVSEENFISLCVERRLDSSTITYSYFNDFNKSYVIKKKQKT